MRYGSLFSGAGLGDFGFEMAGLEVAWQCEVDKYARQVLDLRWPGVKKYDDIRTINTDELERVDLITGGFPCTDISIANNDPEGIAGSRSGLWKEQLRIIGALRPKYCIVENVAALFIRGLGTVLGDLSSLGYDTEYGIIPASWHGAPHVRERVWILAYPKGFGRKAIAFQGQFASKDSSKKPDQWKPLLAINAGAYKIDEQWKEFEGDICGDDDGDANIVDRLKCLGNGQLPQTTYLIGKWLMELENET